VIAVSGCTRLIHRRSAPITPPRWMPPGSWPTPACDERMPGEAPPIIAVRSWAANDFSLVVGGCRPCRARCRRGRSSAVAVDYCWVAPSKVTTGRRSWAGSAATSAFSAAPFGPPCSSRAPATTIRPRSAGRHRPRRGQRAAHPPATPFHRTLLGRPGHFPRRACGNGKPYSTFLS
jgi:hypothetical protein